MLEHDWINYGLNYGGEKNWTFFFLAKGFFISIPADLFKLFFYSVLCVQWIFNCIFFWCGWDKICHMYNMVNGTWSGNLYSG
jgi:hypothetical protein